MTNGFPDLLPRRVLSLKNQQQDFLEIYNKLLIPVYHFTRIKSKLCTMAYKVLHN